ncbi:MAG: YbbR-like domain-containing protein [Bacteroidota bacterium]
MIDEIKNGLQRRKVKIFLIFLLCSFLAWLVSRLSETYTSRTTFELIFTNVPDSLLMDKASKDKIEARLQASGFQFLAFNFNPKQIKIDLSEVDMIESIYYVPQGKYRSQIEKQLSGSMNILDVDRDTLFFEFLHLFEKKLPVDLNIGINLGPNYLLEGELEIEPDTIIVKGPRDELAGIDKVSTLEMVLTDLTDSFRTTAALNKPESLKHSVYSANSVQISGRVFRFSEKIIEVPVEVINLPEGTEIKTFPNVVSLLCKARIEKLKEILPSDFKVVADYARTQENRQFLTVELISKPESVHSAQILQTQVEFILKRE